MPRKVIPLITNSSYHIFNRGTDKRDIFMCKADYIRFYTSLAVFNTESPTINYKLASSSKRTDTSPLVKIEAYSLLPNHFHLLLTQLTDHGISELMKRVLGGYTSYFNDKYDRSGVLFQGKYKRVPINTDEQWRYTFAYVNENHFVHGLKRAEEILYSSSLHYQQKILSKLIVADYGENYDFNSNVQLAKEIFKKRLETDTPTLE